MPAPDLLPGARGAPPARPGAVPGAPGPTPPAHFQARLRELRRALRLSETTWLFVLAAAVGASAGLGAIAFHHLIGLVQWIAFGTGDPAGPLAAVTAPGFPAWRVVLAPALGGLIVGPLVQRFAREAKGHGVPAVVRAVHERGGRISPLVALVKTVASALTLGSGGSLGREGPVVQIGAAVGSGVGQLLGVTPRQLKMLAAGGAAAGLAAMFNAPLGGAFFSLEVIVGSFAMEAFGPVVVASVAATVVGRAVLGDHPVIHAASYRLEHPVELLVYAALGLACGATAVAFTRGVALGAAVFERVRVPEWAKPALGGAAVGLLALELSPRILGNGYETVDALMKNQDLGVLLVLGLVALKLVATVTSLGSGLSGGVFGPSLFLGALVGTLVGRGAAHLLPVAPAAAYALVGMGALVAGATHAPVSMVLMIFEMSENDRIILPLLVATSVSTIVARRLLAESIDTILDARAGRRTQKNLEEVTLHSVHAGEAASVGAEASVPATAPLETVLARFLVARTDLIAVTDAAGRYRGVIPIEGLRDGDADLGAARGSVIALDLVRQDVPVLAPEDPLTRAIDLFHGAGVEALPIVAPYGRFVGLLGEGDVVDAYRHAVLRSELVGTVLTGTPSPGRFELGAGIVTADVPVPPWLAGTTLVASRLRSRSGVSVLAVQTPGEAARLPDPGVPLGAGDRLTVAGPARAVQALRSGIEPEPAPATVAR